MRTCGVAELRTPWGGHLVGRPSSVGALDWRRPRCAAQWRSQLQVAKERLKCSSTKPILKDWTNHPNPPLEPVSKLKHAKEEPAPDKLRKALPQSSSMSQNTSNQPLQLKPELPKASGMHARPVPRTPSATDRRKQLEEWLAAKGRTYKRPPMRLLQKQAVIPSCRKVKPTEKQDNPEQHYQAKINNVLTECLKLIEEGVHAEEISTVLSLVPQAEKFAKFWICQAKLLARSGPFNVLQLYREAVSAGAEPVEELRETALNILKDAGQKLEGEKSEEPTTQEATTPCPAERHPIASTPGLVGRDMTSLPPSVKLQVTSASRGKEFLEGPEFKFLTPVRRSLRTERARSRYPEMLKDHDPVVSSLSEILDAEEGTLFFFRKNKALPEVTELEGLSSYPPKSP
ncbi:LOW QUALITY PROTEIN: cytoskeleton-associated protein 2-like [Geothlypis trichas]